MLVASCRTVDNGHKRKYWKFLLNTGEKIPKHFYNEGDPKLAQVNQGSREQTLLGDTNPAA